MRFAFGEFELDVGVGELRRGGQPVRLQPRVFDTLRHLIEHRDRVVGKQELIDVCWDGETSNPIAVPWSVSHARKALGQGRSQPGPIETVRGRGYRFVAEVTRPATSGAAGTASGELFVGRDDVMDRLVRALTAARAGNGRLCLLTGEAGIGKTRCATELANFARRSGVGVWMGRCVEGAGAPAFWPWIQILRATCADRRSASAERQGAEALLAQLGPRDLPSPETARRPAPDLPDTSRFWLCEALVRGLRRTAEARLRVLILDDLHAADVGSLEALALLAPELAQTKMLVVATSRDGSGAEAAQKHSPMRLRACETVRLSGLTLEDAERYIAGALGASSPPSLARAVHATTGGNPLFLKEAVRLVTAQVDRGSALRAEDVELPEVARQLLHGRISTLDPPTREVLDAASVIGDEFDLPVLQRALSMSAEALLTRIDAAIRARFIEARPGTDAYAFAHTLLRESLYDALPDVTRRRLHARVARALESFAVARPRHAAIAHHFHLALPEASAGEVSRHCLMAGESAMQVFAYDEAAEFYTWALAAQGYADAPDARSSCELLLRCAHALRRAGNVPEARRHCRHAVEIGKREGFADLLLYAARSLRPTVWISQVPDPLALQALEHALKLLDETSKADQARAYGLLACIPPYSVDLASSRALSDRALGLARELGEPSVLLEALVCSLPSLGGPDHIDDLLATADEILRLDGPVVSWWSAEAFFGRYGALSLRGDAAAADRALEAFGECADQLRMPESVWQYERVRAQEAMYAGDFARAEARFDELFAQSTSFRPYALFLYAAQLSALRRERNAKARSAVPLGASPDVAWKWAAPIPAYRATMLLMLIDLGDEAAARAELADLARDDFAVIARDSNYLYALAHLGTAAIKLNDRDAVERLYERLSPYGGFAAVNGLSLSLGSVAHYLGTLARFLGRLSAAEAHLEQSRATNRRLGHEVHALRTELVLAELLVQEPSMARLERARTLAEGIRDGARRLGMIELSEEAEKLLERGPSSSESATSVRPSAAGPERIPDVRPSQRGSADGRA
jgi:DNA-binding winged helix-turn-helix (wHTH) protein/tetratricopeptide (TPR) repeat protein